jgi:lipid II:glycine glycyltransferase (peptidoglycan interpeptide bridge formation enzyme)
MNVKVIADDQKEAYNRTVTHPLQSFEWGEFRKKEGIKVIRRGLFENGKLVSGFQLTIHKIPKTQFTIGYLPKGDMPTKELLEELFQIGKQEHCIFIQLEPNVLRYKNQESGFRNQGKKNWKLEIGNWKLQPAAHPLFTRYTFVLDLTKSEEEILAGMHPKGRYNIKVAKRHNVKVREDNSDKAFAAYWRLMEETTKRQKFYAHTRHYHELQWQTFAHKLMTNDQRPMINHLTSHLFTATYEEKILTALLFFVFHDTLYYPYGASSNEHRNVMHSNLAMWEGILFGKKLGLKKFDMWGALGEEPDPKDSWFGFHDFKRKFGPEHVEFIGSYDLVISPVIYQAYKVADKLRWMYMRMKK